MIYSFNVALKVSVLEESDIMELLTLPQSLAKHLLLPG